MTPPTFVPRTGELPSLCPECCAFAVLDQTTGRCRPCWRAWRWSPVGWEAEREKQLLGNLSVRGGPGAGGQIQCTGCGDHADLQVSSQGMFELTWRRT
jgi:hypothetical protein